MKDKAQDLVEAFWNIWNRLDDMQRWDFLFNFVGGKYFDQWLDGIVEEFAERSPKELKKILKEWGG